MKPLALRLSMHRTMHRTLHRTTSRTTHRVPLRIAVLALLLLVAAGLPACRSADAPRGRVLRVGVAPENPPMIFVQDGELAGVEADLARALGVRLGRRVVFTRLGADQLLPALERGDVDVVMSGLSITPERARRVRFVAPYMQAGQLALIRFADLARFGRIHTIRRPGARVGFVYGTTGERFVGTDLARASSFGFDDVEAGLRSLRAGRIDFFVHDAPTIWRIAGDPAERELHGLYQVLVEESLAWAVRRDDATLGDRLDAEVAAWRAEGGIEGIIDRWIPVRVTIH